MSKLVRSEALGRKVRGEPLEELGIPNWTLIKDAVKAKQLAEACDLVDYTQGRSEAAFDSLVKMADQFLALIADSLGEEAVEKFWRARYTPRSAGLLKTATSVEDYARQWLEVEVGHYTVCTVTEEADRYVQASDPCGSGGRMRRATSARLSKKAYPWTWGQAGVSLYCAHCCLTQEILPIEMRGYPLAITEYNADPNKPCLHLYYKSPELIPEKYFTRVGKKKDPSKFKR